MVRQMLRRRLLALVAIRVLVAMMVMMFTMGMVGSRNMNMRSLSVITWRINGRMRVGKRIPNDEERNN
jgi:hypothetical protein